LTKIGKLEPRNRIDVGKYSFVNRTITDWNQLPEGVIGALTGNTYSFRKRVSKSEAIKVK
jgi:hypothetical protein